MKIDIKVYADLRDKVNIIPKPGIGEPIQVDVSLNETIRDVLNKINLTEENIAIIFVNGVHQSLDYQIVEEDKIALFSPVGGG